MREVNLYLHAGGVKVARQELINVLTPEGTESWQPVAHNALADAVEASLTSAGFSIVSQAHALARSGQRYFGLMQVANGSNPEDYSIIVGMRNSHDKSFPASLCLGSQVFVCDNLAFSGEVKLARKHTKHIGRDLPQLVARAVGVLGDHRVKQDRRILTYKGIEISNVQASDFIARAFRAGVVPKTHVGDVIQAWDTPPHDEFKPRTAWSLFNAFTEVLKGNAANALKRTSALHGLMDAECGLVLAG